MKLFISLILLVLFTLPAWGVDYWVDLSGTGTGAANGTSVSNQCAGTADADCTPSAGDTVYLCNTRSSAVTLGTAGGAGNVIVYDWTCPGGARGAIEMSGSAALTLNSTHRYIRHVSPRIRVTSTHNGVFFSGADDIAIEEPEIEAGQFGVQFSATAASSDVTISGGRIANGQRGINLTITGTSLAYDRMRISGVEITGQSVNGIRLTVESAASTTSSINTLTIDGNHIHDNDGSGIWTACGERNLSAQNTAWCTGGRVYGNLVERNGVGGSSIDGGINVGGHDGAFVHNNTVRNVGVSGGGISFLWGKNMRVYENIVSGIESTNGIDGEGIFIDRYTNDSVVERNDISDTERGLEARYGACVAIFKAARNTVRSNACRNANQLVSFGGAETDGNLVENNSAANVARGIAQGTVASSTPTTQVRARNNAMLTDVCAESTDDQANWSHNACPGVYTGQTAGAGNVTADPKFIGGHSPSTAEGFKLMSISPNVGAGSSNGAKYDYDNTRCGNPSNIGAFCTTYQNTRSSYSIRTDY